MLPTLFVSHGAPDLVIRNSAARDFLSGFGRDLPRPRAILVVSAHFEAPTPAFTVDDYPDTIHDFRGFEPELYEMRYPAPGAPLLAAEAAGLLQRAGLTPVMVEKRGFDHGVWVPLALLYPEADLPVVVMSVEPDKGAGHHYRLGAALAPLRERGVLIVASGSMTHNLGEFFRGGYGEDSPAPDWVAAFGEWVHDRVETGDHKALVDYRRSAPHARDNHPTEEHFLPFFVALGAAGPNALGRRVHASHSYGVLRMDAYQFA